MNLIRIRLDPLKKQTVRGLVNPNIFHGAIESAKTEQQENQRVLWRIDELKGQPYLLMLSSEPLNTQSLIHQFGYPEETAQSAEYAHLLNRVQDGTEWRFRLCANPVCSAKPAEPGKRGKVMAHVSPYYQLEWLSRQGVRNGFQVDSEQTRVTGSKWLKFQKKSSRMTVTLKEAVFEGVLKVTDAERFKQALTEGIGKGKAYGMGLLTVIPYHG